MKKMTDLAPRGVWEIFDEITQVPRPSKKEGKIVAWLVDFAKAHGLEYRTDKIGNVVILKAAGAGMEHAPTVVLQNHVDMVCEKNSGVDFDFEKDAIRTWVDDGWVRARGTTLGADNGLGMAAVLALMVDKTAAHGPLEALFTVDEETGLTGAFNLGEGMITGKYLINLDSEDEGEVFIGCAGGVDTLATFDFEWEPAPSDLEFYELTVNGLRGGHSGDDIEKGRGNSNKILARALWGVSERLMRSDECRITSDVSAHSAPTSPGGLNDDMQSKSGGGDAASFRLASIDGGNLRNAIPREARAVVGIPASKTAAFVDFIETFALDIRAELQFSDADVAVTVAKVAAPSQVIDNQVVRRLIAALVGVPNGVQAMSFAMPGLVETSTNLASVKVGTPTADNGAAPKVIDGAGQIVVTTSQRSSVESGKKATAAAVEAVFALAGARVEHSEGYPGWAPNPKSHLLEVTKNAYEALFGVPVKVRAIHAGLECGLFLEKFPGLDMVSFGPTILGAHSPDERIEVATVEKFWRLLLEVLAELK